MFSVPTLVPALCSVALAQPPQAPPRMVLELIPLQSVCALGPGLEIPLWTTMMSQPDGMELPNLLDIQEDEPQFDPAMVVDFLHSINQDALENDQLNIDANGDTLIVLGNGNAINRIREQVRELRGIVTRPIDIEVTFWRAGAAGPTAAALSAAEYAQFAAAHQPLWQRHTTTRSNQPVSLESSRWSRYVSDVDVEIASKSAIMRPETDAFFEGSNVLVLPHALVGGDEFVAHVQFTHAGRIGNIQRVATGIPDSAAIDAATVASLCGACSGRIGNGGALCITMTGHDSSGSSAILTVRLSSRVPPAAVKTAQMGVFPVSALTSRALLQRVKPRSRTERLTEPGELEIATDEADAGFGCVETDRLTDLLHSTVGDDDDLSIQIAGGYAFVRGSAPATIERAQALIVGLQDRLLRTADVQHTVRLGGGADARSTALHDLRAPSLLGRHLTLMRRIETTIISELYVEVAEESKAVDPAVGLLAFGSWLRARVVAADDDTHLAMLAQCSHCELPEARQMVPAGSLSLPEIASQQVTHDGTVIAGQAIRHGDGATVDVGGQKHRSAAETTVRW